MALHTSVHMCPYTSLAPIMHYSYIYHKITTIPYVLNFVELVDSLTYRLVEILNKIYFLKIATIYLSHRLDHINPCQHRH